MRETPRGDPEAAPNPPLEAVRAFMHDARTPLNAIVAFSDMLCSAARPAAPEDVERWGRLINSAARYLLALTGSVPVDAAGPGIAIGEPAAVELAALADEVLHWLQPQALRADVVIARGPLAGHVRADAASVQRVLTNLLSNAIRHNHAGGSIGLKTVPAIGEGGPVLVEITDSGCGIPVEQVRGLQHGYPSTPHIPPGLGLGVVQDLLVQMGGHLEVTSYRGLGTCVRVSLPAAAHPDEPTAPLGEEH